MKRRQFIRNTGIAGGMIMTSPLLAKSFTSDQYDFGLVDMHVHTTPQFSIEKIIEIGKQKNIQFGIVEHPGRDIADDASLMKYINNLRQYPVYIGLQPTTPGWSENFSKEALSKLDYVLMDPQTFEAGNSYGDPMRIWSFDTYVDDTEKFMEAYMEHTMKILESSELLNIFGWPLFLPVCIARDYYTLWTEERMQKIISAAKKRNIAFEINDLAHTPHEQFINMAKEQGLKFTFGSDTRNEKTGRLDYCKYIAKKCNLKEEDFYRPARKIN
ncbi:MAG TPA: hypothetical protein PK335_11905 [Draconibacterium sp.]|nr:hypothetical protein [Draconibacterium sp.]